MNEAEQRALLSPLQKELMRIAIGLLSALLLLMSGCKPSPVDTPSERKGGARPGAAQEDTGTDRPPAGDSSENAAPSVHPSPSTPSTPTTPPH